MQVRKVEAAIGWRWVADGFRLLRAQPLSLLGMTVLMLFTLILPTALPLIGGFAPLVLTPLLAVGFMNAVRTVDAGKPAPPWLLYSAFRADAGRGWQPLVVLGVANATATVTALMVSMLADGGTLFRIATGALEPNDPSLENYNILYAAIVFLLMYAPIQMAMWYSPMFVAWHQVAPGKALFFSLIAVWRNRGAFVVYALAWFAVAIGVSIALQLLRVLIPPNLLPVVLSPLSLLMLSALYCSFWATYRDAVET
jgi:hypothetical protein